MLTDLPNLLTLSRIIIIPVLVGLFYLDGDVWRWVSVVLFSAAGVTDYFDGYLARRWAQISAFGRFLDPIADKLLVAAVILMLVATGRIRGLVVLPGLVILCREVMVSGLREFLAQANVGVPVSRLAKWKTALQLIALGILIVGEAAGAWTQWAGELGLPRSAQRRPHDAHDDGGESRREDADRSGQSRAGGAEPRVPQSGRPSV